MILVACRRGRALNPFHNVSTIESSRVDCPARAADTPSVSGLRGPSADQRYLRACQECSTATDHLAAQHRRRAFRADVDRPVLDPEYEAALNRLDSAESELRRAYELRYGAGKQLQHS